MSADVEDKSFLECSEKGFALFEDGEEEPLVHLSFNAEASGEKSSQLQTADITTEKKTAGST